MILASDQEGKILMLLAQRSYPEKLAGLWELPGGKQEENESLEQALRRELAEELTLPILSPLCPYPNPESDNGFWQLSEKYQMAVFVVCLPESILLKPGNSHLKLKWEDISKIDNYQWLEGDLPIIKALKNDQNLSGIYRKYVR